MEALANLWRAHLFRELLEARRLGAGSPNVNQAVGSDWSTSMPA
jgi:hypothetical protein